MADNPISATIDVFKNTAANNAGAAASGGGNGMVIGIAIFVGIAIVSVIGAFVWYYFFSKKQWNIETRVHYENPQIDGVSMGTGVPTKRIRFKDGRVVYMYKKPIQGYTISPELLTWTRPREHDVIVTQDKKLFCLNGISSIDVQRKMLNVDVSYPDIEMDRQDLQQHIDSKKFDDPNERFKIIAKVAAWIFFLVAVIVVMVVGSKAYTEGKNADLQRDQMNLQIAEQSKKTMEYTATYMAALKEILPRLPNGGNGIVFSNITT